MTRRRSASPLLSSLVLPLCALALACLCDKTCRQPGHGSAFPCGFHSSLGADQAYLLLCNSHRLSAIRLAGARNISATVLKKKTTLDEFYLFYKFQSLQRETGDSRHKYRYVVRFFSLPLRRYLCMRSNGSFYSSCEANRHCFFYMSNERLGFSFIYSAHLAHTRNLTFYLGAQRGLVKAFRRTSRRTLCTLQQTDFHAVFLRHRKRIHQLATQCRVDASVHEVSYASLALAARHQGWRRSGRVSPGTAGASTGRRRKWGRDSPGNGTKWGGFARTRRNKPS